MLLLAITLLGFAGFLVPAGTLELAMLREVLVGPGSALRLVTLIAGLLALIGFTVIRVQSTREARPAHLLISTILLAALGLEAWTLLASVPLGTGAKNFLPLESSFGALTLSLGLLHLIAVASCLSERQRAMGSWGYRLTLLAGMGLALATHVTTLDLIRHRESFLPGSGPYLGGILSLVLTGVLLHGTIREDRRHQEPLLGLLLLSVVPLTGACACDYLARMLDRPDQIITSRLLLALSHGVLLAGLLGEQVRENHRMNAHSRKLSRSSDLMRLTGKLNQIIAEPTELEPMLERTSRLLVDRCEISLAQIWIRNDSTQMLELVSGFGKSIELEELLRQQVSFFQMGFIVQEQRPYITDDLLGDHFLANEKLARQEYLTALAASPMVLDGKVLGVITLYRSTPFPSEFEETLTCLTTTLALGIQRRVTALEVSRNEQALQGLTDLLPVLIISVNSDEKVVSVNRAHESWFERGSSKIPGLPLCDLLGFAAHETLRPEIEQVLEGQSSQFERLLPLDAGPPRYVRCNLIPLEDSRNQPEGFHCLLTDLTEIHESEARLREARELAEEASRQKSGFLANMSHEIRTPMTAIIGYSEEILEQIEPGEEAEMVSTILHNGQYLLELLNDILDLSRVESGKLEIEHIESPLPPLLQGIRDLLEGKARDKGIDFHIRIENQVPHSIIGDPVRIRQVLINFLGNAIKFTHHGEVLLIVSTSPDRASLIFQVKDSGIGMSAGHLERLFAPYLQADASISRKFGGTGLGLTICKMYVELMGGRIEVQSQENLGSTFTVTLPCHPAVDTTWITRWEEELLPVGERTRSLCPESRGEFCCRILVAEDNPVNRKLVQRVLRKLGAEVEVVENGQQAVDRVHEVEGTEQTFDVIFMDMRMPILDGYEATRRLRDSGYEGVIISLTANAMSGEQDRCLAAGCNAFATKPIDRAQLAELLRRHTGSKTCA